MSDKLRSTYSDPNAVGLLRLLVIVSIVAPVTLFCFSAWLTYNATLRDAKLDLLRNSEVAREQAAKAFNSQRQIGDRVSDMIQDRSVSAIKRSELSLSESLIRICERFEEVRNVLVIDKAGHPLLSSAVYPIPQHLDLSGRDYFKAIVNDRAGVFVGAAQQGSLSGKPIFGVAQPWQASDGTLQGVIVVAANPTYFEDFYRVLLGDGLEDAAGKMAALLREDGQTLVSFAPMNAAPSRTLPSETFLNAVRASPDHGFFNLQSEPGMDRPHQLVAYSKVPNLPVYALVGIDKRMILADWRTTVFSQLVFSAPATVALFTITWTALVRTRRERQALDRAHLEAEKRKQAEAALLKAQRLEAVGQLTGGVAHDFNNLLTVILGGSELLRLKAHDKDKVTTIADQIAMAAKRGSDITRQLLAFSRRQIVHPEIIDPNERLRAFKPLLDQAAQTIVQVSLDLGDSTGMIQVDQGQFEVAVLNLVGNARDAMPFGGKVVIATSNVWATSSDHDLPTGSYVCVTVTDNGTGMDMPTAARAFEPFFTTKGVGKGTGLGLSQVYGFAKQAGGEARITSVVSKGTTVELLLPKTSNNVSPVLATSRNAAAVISRGETILVVEDDANVLRTAVETLKDLGYETIVAASGLQALESLKRAARVDVLFSDVVMLGGMDGAQLAVEARRIRPRLKVLLTSGYTGAACPDPTFGAPILPKPYDRASLSMRLRELLDRDML